ncbi:hypothetical protein MASR1M68_10840 [Elusimicrobiota bacterium]
MKYHFNITSGFNNISVIEELKKAGATELYTGFFDESVNKKYPIAFNILNRRGEDANFTNWQEFKRAISLAEKLQLPVYVTFNGLYIQKQYKLILDTINKVSSLNGVKGIIVNDIALLLLLKENNYKKDIVISTGGTIFNSHTVAFYKSLGAKRIILDRQLSIKDIIEIISYDKTMQYEIFAFGGSCFFIDGFCSFFHCSENLDYNQKIVNTYNVNMCETGCHLIEQNISKFSDYYMKKYNLNTENFISFMRHSCNLCNLYELKKIKNLSLKIVNRKKSSISFVEVVSSAINSLETSKSKKEYIKYCKRILEEKKLFKCNQSQCFYK